LTLTDDAFSGAYTKALKIRVKKELPKVLLLVD